MSNWTEQRERDIRERIQNASPLPWVQDDDPAYDALEDPTGEIVEYLDFSSEPDAALLANSPQDLSDALDEIARLRAERTPTWNREDLERATDAVYEVNKPYLDDLAVTHEWLGNEQLQRAWARTQARAALLVVNGGMNPTR